MFEISRIKKKIFADLQHKPVCLVGKDLKVFFLIIFIIVEPEGKKRLLKNTQNNPLRYLKQPEQNKKVRKPENTLSTKKAIKKERKKERKHALDQESDQEKTITFKKKERKHALDALFLFSFLLVFFYKFSPRFLIDICKFVNR